MKIIKRNKKHLWIECDCCGSILEPKEKDFEECTTKTTDFESITIIKETRYVLTRTEETKWINCPVCQNKIKTYISTKESYELF